MNAFKKIDSNMKKITPELVKLAKSKNYKYVAQYIYEEYKTRSYKELTEEIEKGSGVVFSYNALYSVIKRTRDFMADLETHKVDKKMCRRCKEKPIGDGNTLFCDGCHSDNCRRSSVIEEYGVGQYYFN